jgi:hypothetical protein
MHSLCYIHNELDNRSQTCTYGVWTSQVITCCQNCHGLLFSIFYLLLRLINFFPFAQKDPGLTALKVPFSMWHTDNTNLVNGELII